MGRREGGGNLCTSEGQKRVRAFVVLPPPFMAVAARKGVVPSVHSSASAMVSPIGVTFTWPKGTDEAGRTPLKLSMPASALAERDPEGKTLLSAKMSFVGRSEFTLEASGPGEDEYMVPELIKFIWEYISSGCLEASLYSGF